MKAAKKRFYKQEPEFWKVLKDEHKPKPRNWFNCDINSLYPGQLNVMIAGRSGAGKSMLFEKLYLNSVYENPKTDNLIAWSSYESSEEKISQIRTTGMEIIKSRTTSNSDKPMEWDGPNHDNRLESK